MGNSLPLLQHCQARGTTVTEIGAIHRGEGRCAFSVWAPHARQVALRLVGAPGRELPMTRDEDAYWRVEVTDVAAGSRYSYVLDGDGARPDPASGYQPEGVHGPSEVVDHSAFTWTDVGWEGVPLEDMIIYELHVGTFTPEGTFEAVIPRLAELKELGITGIELMPVAQFPGTRNWGYDGTALFAVQDSYGGPTGLKTLVDAIHRQGMAALLDVVYNHLGPEGNYLREFGPYFTDAYSTPWGQAVNFDGAESNHVRSFFIQNALYWLREYHFDALRLDALHAIYDRSAKHFIQELTEAVEQFCRRTAGHKRYVIGESDLNDVRLIKPRRSSGCGLNAQWSDDFHHSLHALLTGERQSYYEDFGRIEHLAKAYREGFVYSWDYSVYRKRFHGSSSRQRPARQFVVCSQNHDQVGNRMRGERLAHLVDFESLKLAAGTLLLSPYVPLLFMGQEYAEEAPFEYFVSHSDPQLIEAVRQGRKNEFSSFEPTQECPDPQSVETFMNSKLHWQTRHEGRHRILLDFYRRLIELRTGVSHWVSKKGLTVKTDASSGVMTWRRQMIDESVFGAMNFSDRLQPLVLDAPEASWRKALDSADVRWAGPGAEAPEAVHAQQQISLPCRSFAVFRAQQRDEAQERVAATAGLALSEEINHASSDSDI